MASMIRFSARWGLFLSVLLFGRLLPVQAQAALPHLRQQGEAMQLIVDGAPFLMLGGELGNSSASGCIATVRGR